MQLLSELSFDFKSDSSSSISYDEMNSEVDETPGKFVEIYEVDVPEDQQVPKKAILKVKKFLSGHVCVKQKSEKPIILKANEISFKKESSNISQIIRDVNPEFINLAEENFSSISHLVLTGMLSAQ